MRFISLRIKIVLISFLLINLTAGAKDLQISLDWKNLGQSEAKSLVSPKMPTFENAQSNGGQTSLPIYVTFSEVNSTVQSVDISLENAEYVKYDGSYAFTKAELAMISSSIKVDHYIGTTRKRRNAHISLLPIRVGKNGKIELLKSATLRIENKEVLAKRKQGGFQFNDHSKLMTGSWYKFYTSVDGVYRLDYNFLEELGMNPSTIDPNAINIYGNGGQMLPIENSVPRADDLEINAIEIVGGGDGSFGINDYILFYAKGPNTWTYNDNQDLFIHEKHRYSNRAYYFIGLGIDDPERIDIVPVIADPPNVEVSTFTAYSFYESDEVNLNKSGRELYGENFDFQTAFSFSGSAFTYPNIDTSSPVYVKTRVINKTLNPAIGEWEVSCNGNSTNFTVGGVSSSNYPPQGVSKTVALDPFMPTSADLTVNINFQKDVANEEGWLDYIEINARRQLIMSGSQMSFRDINSVGTGNVALYTLSDASSVSQIWDVTDHNNVKAMEIVGDGAVRNIKATSGTLREFIAFKNSGYLTATAVGPVANQDLHGLAQQDMIILTSPVFLTQANELADFHREEGLLVEVVLPQQIYHEFSSGNPDITAIKSFCKMFYDRSTNDGDMLDYLLLLGDASYINNTIDPDTSPLIISYHSQESLNQLSSYITDDYFGFLDDDEGEGLDASVDIGIGRFPVTTTEQVDDIIRKIKLYASANTQPLNSNCFSNDNSVYGDWRTKLIFIADDEDGTSHIGAADDMAQIVENNYKGYNVDKVYIDAYQQETTTGGARYPLVEKDIREGVERGAQIVTYFGHGGEVGWAEERILDVPTINEFTNLYRLPVFLTATCEFSRFDDPNRTSAGELLLLNPEGGAIALLSTSRPVFTSGNEDLALAFFNLALEQDATSISYLSSGDNPLVHGLRLGDICRVTKNGIPAIYNKRNFTLLGDPALRMAYPKYRIEQDMITDDEGNSLNVINALQRVTVSGHVEDLEGNLMTSYNGFITPSVYDKPKNLQTLENDNGSNPFSFELQTNVLYKGNTTVENGEFSFSFIVPKDISYQQGLGRISYYALTEGSDAFGYNYNNESDQSFEISGQNDNAAEDTQGPVIDLFLDNESFVDGGVTNENPILIAKMSDEHGINTSSSGIGHDLTLVLDGDEQNSIPLNTLYQADLDTYQSGSVRYPIQDLTEGTHTLTLKVWDIYNNSSSKTLSFEVASSSDLVLENVVNYPNPFTTYTEFMFQHNQNCSALDVDIQIFTVSGKLVKTIQNTVIPQHQGGSESLSWNGKDEFGDKLGRGVYVYKLKVKTPSGLKEEVFEKLVILN